MCPIYCYIVSSRVFSSSPCDYVCIGFVPVYFLTGILSRKRYISLYARIYVYMYNNNNNNNNNNNVDIWKSCDAKNAHGV